MASSTNDLVIVVITGLPGLGKSFFYKKLALAVEEKQEAKERVCFLHKDLVTSKYHEIHGNSLIPCPKPPREYIFSAAMSALREKKALRRQKMAHKPMVLCFNMNINMLWITELIDSTQAEGYNVVKLVVMSPHIENFRTLQASAIVTATDVRTGREPSDVMSTLKPTEAWEQLTGNYFGVEGKAFVTFNSLSSCVLNRSGPTIPMKNLIYPVPLLNDSVIIQQYCPTVRPIEWNVANLIFPSESNHAAAVMDLCQELELFEEPCHPALPLSLPLALPIAVADSDTPDYAEFGHVHVQWQWAPQVHWIDETCSSSWEVSPVDPLRLSGEPISVPSSVPTIFTVVPTSLPTGQMATGQPTSSG